ncbi:unnamed protein product [Schistosoma rodhaini]|uniref:UV-stimulated scaffold protein A C-terminal domain-containing protein n=1 Tax=Schistosoma rodhaini TaxID=6188 RepID=A0AA85FYJ2_9TREM|nr:unnamed protein product [Schistosoma rodhaini]
MSKTPKEKEIGAVRLQILVDKITTSGSNSADCSLVEETVNICCKSSSTVSDLFRFATVQLRRNHAQIRLGVLRLLRLLSSPQAIVRQLTFSINDAIKFVPLAKCLRNLILDNLQDTFSYMVQLESYSAPILLPKEAAKELQFEAIELLLDWEYELEQGYFDVTPWNPDPSPPLSWVPSQRAKGQLKAFINFLNLDSRPLGNGGSGYCPIKQLIKKIQEQRQQKSQLFKSQLIKSHRLLNNCLNEIEECSESVEENLVSLSTILDILVPNPTSESSEINKMEIIENQPETDLKSMTTMNTFDSLRLHGCLPGSSSGFSLGSTLTIEIQLPCNSKVNSSRASFEPKIYIKRSTETKELEDSATAFARLAAEKHRPKLMNYLETLESTHSMNFDAKLSSKRNEKIEILKQWISRIQTLTSLLYDRIEFIDSEPIHCINNPARTPSISSDDSDFEEVISTTSDTGKSLCYPSSLHENLSCGIMESINSKSLSVTSSDPNQQIVQLTNEDQPKSQKYGTIVTSSTQNIISCNVTTNLHTTSWRDSESVHRFWKPIDPDEYNRPKEYLDSAISWFSTNDTQCCHPNIHSESAHTLEFTKNEVKEIDFTVAPRQLFCWAPLLSGSLCHRCDPSGRCPIHGRIVKRDKITGRPINMNDRKLLQTEMESKRLARQKKLDEENKKKARRHYPGLTNISKKKVGVRGRLAAQVMKKISLRKR